MENLIAPFFTPTLLGVPAIALSLFIAFMLKITSVIMKIQKNQKRSNMLVAESLKSMATMQALTLQADHLNSDDLIYLKFQGEKDNLHNNISELIKENE